MPKDEYESMTIMTSGIHSKLAFSIFVSSELRKAVEKRNSRRQYGAKKAGAETMMPSSAVCS